MNLPINLIEILSNCLQCDIKRCFIFIDIIFFVKQVLSSKNYRITTMNDKGFAWRYWWLVKFTNSESKILLLGRWSLPEQDETVVDVRITDMYNFLIPVGNISIITWNKEKKRLHHYFKSMLTLRQ